jgi:virulence-associated protein VapD
VEIPRSLRDFQAAGKVCSLDFSTQHLFHSPFYPQIVLQSPTWNLAFDLDTAQLQKEYPSPSWQNAYGDIQKILLPMGFTWQQGSVYFGSEEMDAVKCVLAAQTLSNTYPWFKNCVRDIRMLRIEELNDLSPAL